MKKIFYSSLFVLAALASAALFVPSASAQSKEYSVAIAVKNIRMPVTRYFSHNLSQGLKKAAPKASIKQSFIAYDQLSAQTLSSHDALIVFDVNADKGLDPQLQAFVSANKGNAKLIVVALHKEGKTATLPAGVDALTAATPKKIAEVFVQKTVAPKLVSVLGL